MDTTYPEVMYENPDGTFTPYQSEKDIPDKYDYTHNHISIAYPNPDGTTTQVAMWTGTDEDTVVNTMSDEQCLFIYCICMISVIWFVVSYTNTQAFTDRVHKKLNKDIEQGKRDYYTKRNLPIPSELKTKIEIMQEKLKNQVIIKIKSLKSFKETHMNFQNIFLSFLFISLLFTIFYFCIYIQP